MNLKSAFFLLVHFRFIFNFKFYILSYFIFLFFAPISMATECPRQKIQPEYKDAAQFLTNSLYTLHLQLTDENFSSLAANTSRAKIFDTIFNTQYWSQKLKTKAEFNIFWNWIRFQFWGLIQQQALMREDQGYKISNLPNLKQSFSKIFKFPIYPFPSYAKSYICTGNENLSYSCNKRMTHFDVILSPTLACSDPNILESLTFHYILTQENSGWSILDIRFKGKSLISDSFMEYDNLLNKYGSEKALTYLKIHLNKQPLVDPELKPENLGSTAFYKNFKIKAPPYPLNF